MCGFSGTTKKISPLTITVAIPKPKNASRQPIYCISVCIGAVDSIAPIPPTDSTIAVIKGKRSCENHIDVPLIADINDAATPKPIKLRAITKSLKLFAKEKRIAPLAAIKSMGVCTLRGPKRSSITPIGNWASANIRRYELVSSPISLAASPSSFDKSG